MLNDCERCREEGLLALECLYVSRMHALWAENGGAILREFIDPIVAAVVEQLANDTFLIPHETPHKYESRFILNAGLRVYSLIL